MNRSLTAVRQLAVLALVCAAPAVPAQSSWTPSSPASAPPPWSDQAGRTLQRLNGGRGAGSGNPLKQPWNDQGGQLQRRLGRANGLGTQAGNAGSNAAAMGHQAQLLERRLFQVRGDLPSQVGGGLSPPAPPAIPGLNPRPSDNVAGAMSPYTSTGNALGATPYPRGGFRGGFNGAGSGTGGCPAAPGYPCP